MKNWSFKGKRGGGETEGNVRLCLLVGDKATGAKALGPKIILRGQSPSPGPVTAGGARLRAPVMV